MLASVAFLLHALKPEVSLLRESAREIQWWRIGVAILAAIPLFVLGGFYQVVTLDRLGGKRTSRRVALPVYLQAQVVRYLPGKVWGLIYQSHRMADTHRPSEVVVANIWQMSITNLFSISIVLTLLLALRETPLWFACLVPVIFGVEWVHRHPAIESWWLRLLSRTVPSISPRGNNIQQSPVPWVGTILLCAEWLSFLLAFAVLMYGKLDWMDILLLAAWYAGASILALAVFVVPAGIAVREAIFVAAPHLVGMDAATLILIAAMVRLVFFGAELAAAAIASLITFGDPSEHL